MARTGVGKIISTDTGNATAVIELPNGQKVAAPLQEILHGGDNQYHNKILSDEFLRARAVDEGAPGAQPLPVPETKVTNEGEQVVELARSAEGKSVVQDKTGALKTKATKDLHPSRRQATSAPEVEVSDDGKVVVNGGKIVFNKRAGPKPYEVHKRRGTFVIEDPNRPRGQRLVKITMDGEEKSTFPKPAGKTDEEWTASIQAMAGRMDQMAGDAPPRIVHEEMPLRPAPVEAVDEGAVPVEEIPHGVGDEATGPVPKEDDTSVYVVRTKSRGRDLNSYSVIDPTMPRGSQKVEVFQFRKSGGPERAKEAAEQYARGLNRQRLQTTETAEALGGPATHRTMRPFDPGSAPDPGAPYAINYISMPDELASRFRAIYEGPDATPDNMYEVISKARKWMDDGPAAVSILPQPRRKGWTTFALKVQKAHREMTDDAKELLNYLKSPGAPLTNEALNAEITLKGPEALHNSVIWEVPKELQQYVKRHSVALHLPADEAREYVNKALNMSFDVNPNVVKHIQAASEASSKREMARALGLQGAYDRYRAQVISERVEAGLAAYADDMDAKERLFNRIISTIQETPETAPRKGIRTQIEEGQSTPAFKEWLSNIFEARDEGKLSSYGPIVLESEQHCTGPRNPWYP